MDLSLPWEPFCADFAEEVCGDWLVPFQVPAECRFEFSRSFFVKLNFLACAKRELICSRSSSHGIVRAFPESKAAMRAAIS
jgi:hypothetical protein